MRPLPFPESSFGSKYPFFFLHYFFKVHYLSLYKVHPYDHLTLYFQKRVKLAELLLILAKALWIS
jgi:hypothetical protein